ncbi:hypothetical protein IG631_13216 [Alternaria alternata]|nr:hypothetical protein IG631_13216 [Alternaria alternata]
MSDNTYVSEEGYIGEVGRVNIKIRSCCTSGSTAACKVGNKSCLAQSAQGCSSQPQRAGQAHRYLSTLICAAAYQELLNTHGLFNAFQRSCLLRGETAGMCPSYLKSTFQGCSLNLCHLSFFFSPPSSLQSCTIANKQGGINGELGTALTERATAWPTTRFLASEANVLEEQELLNRCALHLSVLKNTRDNP